MARIRVGDGRSKVSFIEALNRCDAGDVLVLDEGEHTVEVAQIAHLHIVGAGNDPARTVIHGKIEVQGILRLANVTIRARHFDNALVLQQPESRVDVENSLIYGDPTATYPAIYGDQATIVLKGSSVYAASGGVGINLQNNSHLWATGARLSHMRIDASRAVLTDVHTSWVHCFDRGRIESAGVLDVAPPEGNRWLVLEGESTCRVAHLRAMSGSSEALSRASFLQIDSAEIPEGAQSFVIKEQRGLVQTGSSPISVEDPDAPAVVEPVPAAPQPKVVRWRQQDARRFSEAVAPQVNEGDTVLLDEGEYFFDEGDGESARIVTFNIAGTGKAENTVINGALCVMESTTVAFANLTVRRQGAQNAIMMRGDSLTLTNIVIEELQDSEVPALYLGGGMTVVDDCRFTASPDAVSLSIQTDEHAQLHATDSALGWVELVASSTATFSNCHVFRLWAQDTAQAKSGEDLFFDANTQGQRQIVVLGQSEVRLTTVTTDATSFEAFAETGVLAIDSLDNPEGGDALVFVGSDATVDVVGSQVRLIDQDAPVAHVTDDKVAPEAATADRVAHPETVNEILAELSAIVGQDTLKKQITTLLAQIELAKKRQERGLKAGQLATHMVFTGPPGTGKTTVARLIGRLYHALGVLPSDAFIETDREGLVADVIGGTEANTARAIKAAIGGVLFIDEAYALAHRGDNDFGQQAIDTLLKALEDRRGEFVCIVAGYTDEMQRFVESNPGVRSRFTKTIAFAPYSAAELVLIAEQMADGGDNRLTQDAASELRGRLEAEELRGGFASRSWGNAREMRNVVEAAAALRDVRLSTSGDDALDIDALQDLSTVDIAAACDQADLGGAGTAETVDDVVAELNAQVGQESLKKQVRSILANVRAQQARELHGKGAGTTSIEHMIFTGPPGTGKTTIARLLARLYRALGILPANTVVEVDRGGLVAGYVGQTAIQTAAKIDEALGGVLFIDEAYALASSPGGTGHDFGKEAIDTLLKRMEDDRGKFMVVAAGYPSDMQRFVESNPGLRSRFTKTISFSAYTAIELSQIAQNMASHAGQYLTSEARDLLDSRLQRAESAGTFDGREWGNARAVRNIVDEAIRLRNMRLFDYPSRPSDQITPEELETLTEVDLAAACDEYQL